MGSSSSDDWAEGTPSTDIEGYGNEGLELSGFTAYDDDGDQPLSPPMPAPPTSCTSTTPTTTQSCGRKRQIGRRLNGSFFDHKLPHGDGYRQENDDDGAMTPCLPWQQPPAAWVCDSPLPAAAANTTATTTTTSFVRRKNSPSTRRQSHDNEDDHDTDQVLDLLQAIVSATS